VVTRTVYPVVPPKVEYALSEFGAGLRSVTSALEIWGQALVAEHASADADEPNQLERPGPA
jgi:DNA-binding HxlR family transcriptional regulator